jgi:hypothetical protein
MALPDFYSQWTQARQNGAQRADDQAVRQNIGGALQGDSGALASILKASPQTGMQVQQYAQGQQKLKQEDAGKAASMFAQTGDPQFYAMWKQSLAGLPNAPQLPDALEPDDIEPAKQSAMAFAQAYGGMAAGGNNVQSRFVGEDGQIYALMRNGSVQPLGIKADPNMQIIEGQGGYFGVNKRNLQANPVQVGQPGVQTPPPGQVRYSPSDGVAIPSGEQDEFQMAMQASALGQDVTIPVGGRPQFGGGQLQAAPKQTAQTELEKRLALADQMGASPEEKRRMVIGREGAAAGAKPIPVGALKEMLSIEDSLGSTKLVAETLAKHAHKLQSGELAISPMNAVKAAGREFVGMATTNDTNLREFKADITRTVNEWLRMNKGVQTEGDAQREYKAIMDSNDPVVVARSIERLSRIMQNTVQIQVRKREAIQRNYGQGGQAAQPAQQAVKRARNPQTGETLVLVNGQWVPE